MSGNFSSGRHRKSDEEKHLIGTYRADRAAPALAIPENPITPRKPPEIQGHAAKFWRRHARDFAESGLLTPKNVEVFATLCRLWGVGEEMREDVEAFGWIETAPPSGVRKIRAEGRLWLDLHTRFLNMAREFGLTPLSAQRLRLKKPEKKKDTLSDFMGGRN
ncbi:MAG: hypothetical protein CMN78_05545 [Spirochaetales bacterium]|nr:hypothetical protein [Spirochaetales bacterium]